MYNSLRIEKGNLTHPSKAFVDFTINDQTSNEQNNRMREEGYTAIDMLKYLFHLKDNEWIQEFQLEK